MCQLTRFDFRVHPQGIDHPVYVRAGQTLEQMLLEASRGAPIHEDIVVVGAGGYEVPRKLWGKIKPAAGKPFLVVNHGINGSGARNVLMIMVAAAAIWISGGAAAPYLGSAFAAGTFGAAALAAGVMVGGMMLVDKLAPLPQPTTSTGTQGQWNQITGFRNRANQWGAVPCVLGEDVIYPPYAAAPYSEVVGQTSYHYYLFDLGHGDLLVDQMTINGTPVGDFGEVEVNVTRTPRMYVNTVFENQVTAQMDDDDDVVIRTTEEDTDRISIDLLYQLGLFGTGTSGKDFDMYTGWSIRYRPHGDEEAAWALPPSPKRSRMSTTRPTKAPPGLTGVDYWVSGMFKDPFGATLAWDVPRGKYDVRIRRVTSHRGSAKNTYVDGTMWSTLRSIRLEPPVTTDTNKVEMRIRATDRLTGFLDAFRCRVRQKVPVYDPETDEWQEPAPTTNAAWVTYWHMTRNPALRRRASDEEMHLDEWLAFAEYCDVHGLEVRTTADARQPNREIIAKGLGAAMASLGKRDGKWVPVWDRGEVTPSMSFSGLDVKDFKVECTHRELPHAVRVQFKNVDADYREDEVIILADGYSYQGLDARGEPSDLPSPTRWEQHRLELALTPQQVWMLVRNQLAQAEYRPYVASWSSTRAGLRAIRGTPVRVSHDAVEWGTGAGFVTEVQPGGYGGAVATIRLDETIGTEVGKTYQIQLRHRFTAETYVLNCTPHSTSTDTFYLMELPPLPDGPEGATMSLANVVQPGDVAVVGESEKVSQVLLVTSVRYPDLQRPAFTAVAYDPRVAAYWTNPPENIPTALGSRASELPEPPDVIGVISSPRHDRPDDAGIVGPSIRIGVRPRSRTMIEELLQV